MAPKLHNRDPMDVNDSSPNNQKVSASSVRGQGRDRGPGCSRGRGRGRGGRSSRRHEEVPTSSSSVSMHEPGDDFLVKISKLR